VFLDLGWIMWKAILQEVVTVYSGYETANSAMTFLPDMGWIIYGNN